MNAAVLAGSPRNGVDYRCGPADPRIPLHSLLSRFYGVSEIVHSLTPKSGTSEKEDATFWGAVPQWHLFEKVPPKVPPKVPLKKRPYSRGLRVSGTQWHLFSSLPCWEDERERERERIYREQKRRKGKKRVSGSRIGKFPATCHFRPLGSFSVFGTIFFSHHPKNSPRRPQPIRSNRQPMHSRRWLWLKRGGVRWGKGRFTIEKFGGNGEN